MSKVNSLALALADALEKNFSEFDDEQIIELQAAKELRRLHYENTNTVNLQKPAQVNPAFQAIADAEVAEAEAKIEVLRRLREQDCSQNIESQFNACMYREYCLSLKSKLQFAEEAAHHCPATPELEAAINASLGLTSPSVQQVREFARNNGQAIITGHQEYSFTDARLHRFVLEAIKEFAAPKAAKRALTDDEICEALAIAYPDDADPDGSWKLAQYERDIFRLAERAHGIGTDK